MINLTAGTLYVASASGCAIIGKADSAGVVPAGTSASLAKKLELDRPLLIGQTVTLYFQQGVVFDKV
jgi:hypothetical protein